MARLSKEGAVKSEAGSETTFSFAAKLHPIVAFHLAAKALHLTDGHQFHAQLIPSTIVVFLLFSSVLSLSNMYISIYIHIIHVLLFCLLYCMCLLVPSTISGEPAMGSSCCRYGGWRGSRPARAGISGCLGAYYMHYTYYMRIIYYSIPCRASIIL